MKVIVISGGTETFTAIRDLNDSTTGEAMYTFATTADEAVQTLRRPAIMEPFIHIPRKTWQKDAFGIISEYLMRAIHEYRNSIVNCFDASVALFKYRAKPRRKFNTGTRYRMCSTRVI